MSFLLFRCTATALLFLSAGYAQTAPFAYRFHSVINTSPGQLPQVRFSVVNPSTGKAYDIKTHPAFTAPSVSRLNVQIGWDTKDFHNTGSGSELDAIPAAAQPVAIDALLSAVANGDGTYTVTSPRPIPPGVTGTGIAFIEGRLAGPDASGSYTVTVMVRNAYMNFVITGTKLERRVPATLAKCNVCHGTLSAHGSIRNGRLEACATCHNPNATDIKYRQFGDGPEVAIDFKYMVHAIHMSTKRQTPYSVMGRNHVLKTWSFPFNVTGSRCLACHPAGTYQVPLSPNVLATTTVTNSVINQTQKIVNNDPADDLNISPVAAVCSSCHDTAADRLHMTQNGADFSTLQQRVTSGAVTERCAQCHGVGKPYQKHK